MFFEMTEAELDEWQDKLVAFLPPTCKTSNRPHYALLMLGDVGDDGEGQVKMLTNLDPETLVTLLRQIADNVEGRN